MLKTLFSLSLLLSVGLNPNPAPAATIFSNFAPNYGHDLVYGNWVGNTNTGWGQVMAVPFVSTLTARVAAITLPIGEYVPASHNLILYLRTDASGYPGSTIETFSTPISAGYPNNIVTIASNTHPLLMANTKYWIVAEANLVVGAFNYSLMWSKNSIGDIGPYLYSCQMTSGGCSDAGPWNTNLSNELRPAFEIAAMPAYTICPLYDATKAVKSGSTLPIKFQVCDASSANLSSPTLIVHALSIVQVSTVTSDLVGDAGNANPDNDFRYDSTLGGTGGYIFNLKTTGLSTGTYDLQFTIGSDPVTYRASFQVK